MNKSILIFILLFGISFAGISQVRLKSFKTSGCDKSRDPYGMDIKITNQYFEDNVFVVTIATSANCCAKIVPSIKFKNGVLHLQYKEKGPLCKCMCCYNFVYHIRGLKDKKFKIMFSGLEVGKN